MPVEDCGEIGQMRELHMTPALAVTAILLSNILFAVRAKMLSILTS
jgi:hypothetical protein